MLPIFVFLTATLATTVANASKKVAISPQQGQAALVDQGQAAEDETDDDYCEISSNPTQVRPSECCFVGDILPFDFREKFKKCDKIYPFTYEGSDNYDEDPWTLWVYHTACLDECIYWELGLLNDTNKIDMAAVRESFTEGIFEPVLTAVNYALDNCFAIYEKELEADDVSNELECTSGATELLGCYMREVFLNCPDACWRSTRQCSALWDKVNSCPKIHVMLHKPSLPQTASNGQRA